MNNLYLFEKEPLSKHNTNLASTIPGRFGAIILWGLAVLSLAGCGGGGNGSGSSMQIRPPSGDGPDLVVHSISVDDNTLTLGQRFTLSVRVRNQGNRRSPATTLGYAGAGTDLTSVEIRSLGPGETSPTMSFSMTARSRPGTVYVEACLAFVSGESNTSNNCDRVRVTISSGSGDGGSNGGGPSGGSGTTTATWSCPFSSGALITVGHSRQAHDGRIRFRGNTCIGNRGNYWVSAPGAGIDIDGVTNNSIGHVYYSNDPNPNDGGRRGIYFDNFNRSGRTVVRQYTAYFCLKSEVSDSAFCYRGQESFTSTFTVRWLSAE